MDHETAKKLILSNPLKVVGILDKFTIMLDELRMLTGAGTMYQMIADKHLENVRLEKPGDLEALQCAQFLSEHFGPRLIALFDITDEQAHKYPHLFEKQCVEMPTPPKNPSQN